jgi:membrane protease YdiL (CAAX protease family)
LERPITRKFDWHLGAAFLAAPFYWWLLAMWTDAAVGGTAPDPRQLLLVGLVYPVLEELVFRGALQGWLRKQEWGTRQQSGMTLANLVTSAVFAAAHVLQRASIGAAAVFVPGLIFGYFRDRYGNLYASIALHIFYNSGLLLLF